MTMTLTIRSLRHEYRDPRRARGIAAVEFVISVPLLIFAALIAAELGRAFIQYDTLSYAVRSGARYVSERALVAGVINLPDDVKAEARRLVVYGNVAGSGVALLPGLSADVVPPKDHISVSADAATKYIKVSATYPYQPIFLRLPGVGAGGGLIPTDYKLRVSVTMRAIS
jgi:Flp pilus assembly protein TadG